MNKMSRLVALVAVPLTLLAAGCQGGAAAAAPTVDAHEQALEYAQCMREHGVDMVDSGSDTGSGHDVATNSQPAPTLPDKETLDDAIEACRDFTPGGDGSKASPEQLEQQRTFARCMRENGVPDFPDPDPNGQLAGGGSQGSSVDRDAFDRAARTCNQKTPATTPTG